MGATDSLDTVIRMVTAQLSVHVWLVMCCRAPISVALQLQLQSSSTNLACICGIVSHDQCAQCEVRKHSVDRLLGDECESANACVVLIPFVPSGQVQTWLILPVVICLSQRLSHACLSINLYTVKLRMAH